LLLALPAPSLEWLLPKLHLHEIVKGQVIGRSGRRVEHCHFIERGLISFVKSMQDGRSVQIATIGIDGITSPHTLLGFTGASADSIVTLEGHAFAVEREALIAGMARDPVLKQLIQRYAHFAFSRVAQSAACNRLHHLEQRYCGWLLAAHDNAQADTFNVTHELLSFVLGVQRSGVSIAADSLQKSGLIKYSHGKLTITNRSGLERTACECYSTLRAEFANVLQLGQSSTGRSLRMVRDGH
jgi:CRP-like cAMP-binding protein